MGRLPRPTGDDFIYHAINRGNNRADVLGPDGERDMFLGDLARTKARYPFALFGYCLMSNHFHQGLSQCQTLFLVQVSRFAAGWLAASLRVFALDAGVSLACVLRVPSPY